MLDLLLKDFGPLWLLMLFPLMFLMIGQGAWQIHRKAQAPEELARFAGFPKRLADHPRRCRLCSVTLFMGICLIASALVGIPVWAFLNNEMARTDSIASAVSAERALFPLEASLMISGYGGVFLVFAAYLVAFQTRPQAEVNQDQETPNPLAQNVMEGDDESGKEQGRVS